MSITDKELLTFCNLTNLKIEYANLIKKYEVGPKDSKGNQTKIAVNHTIYTLIRDEIISQEKRKELKLDELYRKLKKLEETQENRDVDLLYRGDFRYEEDEKGNIKKHYNDYASYKLDSQVEDLKKEIKELAKKLEGEIGPLYRITDKKEVIFCYENSNELRKESPIVMEYYDRYSDSNEETKFLNEWDLLYSGDSYEINKTLLLEIIESIKTSESRKNEIIKDIPTRDEVERGKLEKAKQEMILTLAEYLDYTISITGITPFNNALRAYNLNKTAWIKEKIDEYVDVGSAKDSVNYIFKLKNESDEYNKKIQKTMENLEIKKINNFSEMGIKILLLRKKEEYVIAIEDKKELIQVDEQLNKGGIPKEVWQLIKISDYLINKYCNGDYSKVTLTGFNNSGKLVTLFGLLNEKIKSVRPFYIAKPLNIGTVVDFSEKDITDVMEGMSYLNNWELLEDSLGKEVVIITFQIIYALATNNPQAFALKSVLIALVPPTVNFIFKISEKRILSDYLKFMIKEKIIDEKLESNKNYLSEKIVGKVSKEAFNNKYLVGEHLLDLESYLQIKVYEIIERYKVIKDIKLEKNEIKLLKREDDLIDGVIFLKIENNKIAFVDKYQYTGDYRIERKVPEDQNDWMGKKIYNTLKLFNIIQENYEKINHKAFYIENDKIESFEKLSLKVEEQSSDKSKAKSEYYYLPYILEDGNIEKKVSKEYIGSFLRSTYLSNNDYYDLTSILERGKDTHFFETTKKGDLINQHLLAKMKESNQFPHYGNVINQVEQKPSILEEFYEIETKDKKSGTIKIGLLDSNKMFDKNKIAYSYNLNDKITTKIVEVPVFFSSLLEEDEGDSTNEVLDGAILKCSEGTSTLELKVLSQNFMTTNGLLNATVSDYEGKKSITPKGTLCNKMKKSGNPQPCMQYISTEEWKPGSKGTTLNDSPILLATCKCKCSIGGTISIIDSKGITTLN